MTMKPTHLLAAAIITALILACLAAPAAAFSGAGSGTESNPYIVTTPAELQSINDDLSAHYILGNDIDMTGQTWSVLGSSSAPFSGSLDGDGKTISDLSISSSGIDITTFSYGGLFKNIKFDGLTITHTYSSNSVGNRYMCLFNDAEIEQCIFTNIDFSTTVTITGTASLTWRSCLFYMSSVLNCDFINYDGSGTVVHSAAPVSTANRFVNPDIGYLSQISNTYILDITLSASNVNGATSGKSYYDYLIPWEIGSTGALLNSVVINGDYTSTLRSGSKSTYYTAYRLLNGDKTGTNNYGSNVKWNGDTLSSTSTTSPNGANVDAATYQTQAFWGDTLGWDFINIWTWDNSANMPILKVFAVTPPTISSISATPATGGQLTEYTLSASATTEAEGGITSYQWAYSTDSGNTWQPISGATTATYVWQPGTAFSGAVLLKCTVTGADGGMADSYEAGYTNIKITIVPPPEIDSVSVSRPLQKINTPTTLTATFGDIQTGNSYQWYYSTNGGTTWQAISGATQPTAQYTPTTTGTHNIKIVVTTQYGDTTETTTSITVLPTYTPTPITQTTFDVSIDATAKYQGAQQFELSAELKALNYYTPTLAHLAHDNALYYLDSAALEVIPVSTTTGGTISAAYLGEYTGIITDTAGNTAFYSYQTNDWQYIEQNDAQIIASTASYAATVSGGTLRIYNLNGNLVASTATTAANLAGNDASNVFVSYSGSTLTYYWVNGNSISSATQTVTNAITELHQISGTSNFIISTAKNTVIAEISDTGVYSLVATSNTDTPLIHTQATSINIFIGVAAPNEIFIIGADGETDGTYQTGSTLSDASIAKSTGLFAIAGGADYQAYILSKSKSSVWQLAQVVAFDEAIDYSQISTTGTYAAVSTGLKLYLLEAKDTDTSTYYLQGVVIGSTGKPYAGKTISINGDTIRTDTNGMFLYPVQPGKLLIITAGDTTVEYTPSNAALQQIAIRIKAGLLSTEVTYNAEYSAEAQAIVMSYDDSAGKTTAVNWNVYETANNTLVATYTGNSASFPIAPGDVYNNYYVQLSADRGAATVANTWSITPAGGQPVDLYGLDEDGRNIIFGFLLLLLAGLFGVMHSRSGAILVAFGACIMRYLELITIPWILIIIAVVLAIVAAIAHGGLNR